MCLSVLYIVYRRLDLREGVEGDREGERGELRARAREQGHVLVAGAAGPGVEEVVGLEVGGRGGRPQGLGGAVPPLLHLGGGLDEADALGEHLAVVVLRDDREGLGDRRDLGGAGLAALGPLRVEVHAGGLQVLQELDVLAARGVASRNGSYGERERERVV